MPLPNFNQTSIAEALGPQMSPVLPNRYVREPTMQVPPGNAVNFTPLRGGMRAEPPVPYDNLMAMFDQPGQNNWQTPKTPPRSAVVMRNGMMTPAGAAQEAEILAMLQNQPVFAPNDTVIRPTPPVRQALPRAPGPWNDGYTSSMRAPDAQMPPSGPPMDPFADVRNRLDPTGGKTASQIFPRPPPHTQEMVHMPKPMAAPRPQSGPIDVSFVDLGPGSGGRPGFPPNAPAIGPGNVVGPFVGQPSAWQPPPNPQGVRPGYAPDLPKVGPGSAMVRAGEAAAELGGMGSMLSKAGRSLKGPLGALGLGLGLYGVKQGYDKYGIAGGIGGLLDMIPSGSGPYDPGIRDDELDTQLDNTSMTDVLGRAFGSPQGEAEGPGEPEPSPNEPDEPMAVVSPYSYVVAPPNPGYYDLVRDFERAQVGQTPDAMLSPSTASIPVPFRDAFYPDIKTPRQAPRPKKPTLPRSDDLEAMMYDDFARDDIMNMVRDSVQSRDAMPGQSQATGEALMRYLEQEKMRREREMPNPPSPRLREQEY